jgi:hypothetical protein
LSINKNKENCTSWTKTQRNTKNYLSSNQRECTTYIKTSKRNYQILQKQLILVLMISKITNFQSFHYQVRSQVKIRRPQKNFQQRHKVKWKESYMLDQILNSFFLLLLFFDGTMAWTQDPVLATQLALTLSHAPPDLFCSYFSGRVSSFCSGLASDCDLPTYPSHIAGITGVCHYA